MKASRVATMMTTFNRSSAAESDLKKRDTWQLDSNLMRSRDLEIAVVFKLRAAVSLSTSPPIAAQELVAC